MSNHTVVLLGMLLWYVVITMMIGALTPHYTSKPCNLKPWQECLAARAQEILDAETARR